MPLIFAKISSMAKCSIRKLKITGNTITQSGTFPKLHPNNPAIKIKSSKNITFKNNTYTGDAKTILETDQSMEKIIFQ